MIDLELLKAEGDRKLGKTELESYRDLVMEDPQNMSEVENQTEDFVIEMMKYYIDDYYKKDDVYILEYIYRGLQPHVKTDKVNELYVRHYPAGIKDLENQTEELCLLALSKDDHVYKYIRGIEDNDDLKMKCIDIDPWYLNRFKDYTEDMAVKAVKSRCWVFYNIDSDKITLRVLDAFIEGLESIKEPIENQQLWGILRDVPSEFRTEDLFMKLVNIEPRFLKELKSEERVRYPKVCLTALSKNGLLLECVENPTREMKLTALRSNGSSLQFIDKNDQDEEMVITGIKSSKDAFNYTNLESQAIYDALVEKSAIAIKQVPKKYRHEEMLDSAMRRSPLSVKYLSADEIKDIYVLNAISKNPKLIKDILRLGYDSECLVDLVLIALSKEKSLFDFVINYRDDSFSKRVVDLSDQIRYKWENGDIDPDYVGTIEKWLDVADAIRCLGNL